MTRLFETLPPENVAIVVAALVAIGIVAILIAIFGPKEETAELAADTGTPLNLLPLAEGASLETAERIESIFKPAEPITATPQKKARKRKRPTRRPLAKPAPIVVQPAAKKPVAKKKPATAKKKTPPRK